MKLREYSFGGDYGTMCGYDVNLNHLSKTAQTNPKFWESLVH
jgi:hypothetical protein